MKYTSDDIMKASFEVLLTLVIGMMVVTSIIIGIDLLYIAIHNIYELALISLTLTFLYIIGIAARKLPKHISDQHL